jgi:hypothetical protein
VGESESFENKLSCCGSDQSPYKQDFKEEKPSVFSKIVLVGSWLE